MTRPPQPATTGGAVLRDQRWARHAYMCVAKIPEGKRRDYKAAVNDLGANILRGGLLAAIASVQRLGTRDLLDHLADAGITGCEGTRGEGLAAKARSLDTDTYLLATREALEVAAWLKRATQATFGGE